MRRKIDESGCYQAYRPGFKSCQDHVSEIPQKIRSPDGIKPFPKAPSRQVTTNRQHGTSKILTKTPIKAVLDAELVARMHRRSVKKTKMGKVQVKEEWDLLTQINATRQ